MPIRIWLVIALVVLAYNKFEYLKCLIYKLPFIYEGLIVLNLLFSRLRNCLFLRPDTWKVIYQLLIILLYSSFLLKFHNIFDGDMRVRLNFFVLLTNAYRDYLVLLGQSQNSMTLDSCLLKNNLRFFKTAINYCE